MENKILTPREFTPLHQIYGDKILECKTYIIDSFVLTHEQVRRIQTNDMFAGNSWHSRGLKHDFRYVRLMHKYDGYEEVMMSDAPMEQSTNEHFIKNANGDVLIFGLGLGMIILPLLQCDEVKSITIVELFNDLIEVVEPVLKPFDLHNKLTIVQGDAMTYHYHVKRGTKFDCVYGDIWETISGDNHEDMVSLSRIWRQKLNKSNPNKFVSHWCKQEVARLKAAGRRFESIYL